MFVSVILSTYNQPLWLDKVLYGYMQQTYTNFEIVIADDGSNQTTLELINAYKEKAPFVIKHVWHEDDGFRKCAIMNKAILESAGTYLLFSDGDCIPRADFVEKHVANSAPGYFLSGGMYRLLIEASQRIMYDDISTQKCFSVSHLITLGQKRNFMKDLKCTLSYSPLLAKIANKLTPTRASWNGHNASGWKSDILEARGFDERMRYGGEDRELGERLFNKGLKSKQIRYTAICIHLEHSRGYVNKEDWDRNNQIRKITVSEKVKQTEYGLKI